MWLVMSASSFALAVATLVIAALLFFPQLAEPVSLSNEMGVDDAIATPGEPSMSS